jgi:PAS domain S-box-containing protein
MIQNKDPLQILVVEDNPGDYVLIKENLVNKLVSPTISHVKNFKDASALLQGNTVNYDVVLLDLSLQDKSGEALITEVLSLCPNECPVIVLTGYEDIGFSIKSLSMGVADYLLKDDMDANSLFKSIMYSIQRKKAIIALEASENRFSNLFQLTPQPMWVFDTETYEFVQVNKAAIEKYGYSKEEFLSMTIMDIRPKEDISRVKKTLSKLDKEKKSVFNGSYRHCKKSKEIIDVEIFSNTVLINDKEYRSVIAIDITEKLRYEYKLTKAIIKTQDDERYEIGSELHDNVCQLLATSKLSLGMLKSSLPPSALEWFNKCNDYIMLASEEIRSLSHRLAPAFLSDTTLEDAFRLLLNSFNVGGNYNISLHFDTAIKHSELNREIQLNLYRILQEQLKNILKYAHARSIEVEVLIHQPNLTMRIADDGQGFYINKVKKGIGLANIQRRAELFSGTMGIVSAPGKGCEVTVKIPLQEIYARR